MFSCFVDGKVISRWADRDPMQQLFDSRLERERLYDTDEEDSRNCRYRKCTSLFESGNVRVLMNKTGWNKVLGYACCCKMSSKIENVFLQQVHQSKMCDQVNVMNQRCFSILSFCFAF